MSILSWPYTTVVRGTLPQTKLAPAGNMGVHCLPCHSTDLIACKARSIFPTNVGFLCDSAVMFRDKTKCAPCINRIVTSRHKTESIRQGEYSFENPWVRGVEDERRLLHLYLVWCVHFVMRHTVCTKNTEIYSRSHPYVYVYINVIYRPTVGREAQSVQRLTTGWTVRDRILVGTSFSARPDRPWGSPSLL